MSDAALSARIQRVCVWCGPAFVVLLFGGWGFMGGLFPMMPPDASAAEVAARYASEADLHRLGLVLGMVGVFLSLPFFFAISVQMRRAERGLPLLAGLQILSGILVTVVLMIPMLLFLGASFRPERPAELTRLVNELSYLMLILPWPPIIGQLLALAVCAFNDRGERPVLPRWTGYYQLWNAVLLTPASLIVFFDDGPFAWDGILGFYIPAAVFGSWYLVMTWVLLRAIAQEQEEAA